MKITSHTNSLLAEPAGEERISDRSFGYVSQHTRDSLFDLVTLAFIESGVSKATLAKRLGKDPAQLTRILHASGNWTIDTCAELLFAINGSFLKFEQHWPLSMPEAQDRTPALARSFSVSVHVSSGSLDNMKILFGSGHEPTKTNWTQGTLLCVN
jgi:plasmid maintenance system antidote protein VapI